MSCIDHSIMRVWAVTPCPSRVAFVPGFPLLLSPLHSLTFLFDSCRANRAARCPRGVLLAGPPGTGKTMLARAVANEAGVPFLSCTGSDFVEVFVGRGARRVRTLFDEAARRAPCVLFIDELDALGSSRSGRSGGGTEEHDQTLNQLLAMMDGISARPGVLVIAATNRLSSLDSALTRPGRFDRILQLQLPDEAARLAILAVHAKRTQLHEADRVLPGIAKVTDGFSGADLAHVVNEAAIFAVRSQVRLPSSSPQLACPQLVCDTFMVRASSDRIRW